MYFYATQNAQREASNFRLSVVREVATSINALRDLRMFLLDDNHEKELSRLTELCDVCERLERLKATGILDTVADTMIRLAEGK